MRKINAILITVIISGLIFSTLAEAKRAPAKEVEPVRHNGIKYIATHDKIGYVQAWDVETDKMLWELKAYAVEYDPNLEKDVQDIFITSLSIEDNKLIVVNERGNEYALDLKTQEVEPIQENYIPVTFRERFEQIKVAMTKDEVLELVGEPLKKKVSALPQSPFGGPHEVLTGIIGSGSEYEEWEYEVDYKTYLIWFNSVQMKPEEEWRVIGKTDFPRGAVF